MSKVNWAKQVNTTRGSKDYNDRVLALAKTHASNTHCIDLCWDRIEYLGGWFIHDGEKNRTGYPESKSDDNVIVISGRGWRVHFRRGDTDKQCHAAATYGKALYHQDEFMQGLDDQKLVNDVVKLSQRVLALW